MRGATFLVVVYRILPSPSLPTRWGPVRNYALFQVYVSGMRSGTNALVHFCEKTGDWCCANLEEEHDPNCCDQTSRRFTAHNQDPAPEDVYTTMQSFKTTSGGTAGSTGSDAAPFSTQALASSKQTKVGLGVGLSQGFLTLVAAAIAILYLVRRRRNAQKVVGPSSSWSGAQAVPLSSNKHKDLMYVHSNEVLVPGMSGRGVPAYQPGNHNHRAELGGMQLCFALARESITFTEFRNSWFPSFIEIGYAARSREPCTGSIQYVSEDVEGRCAHQLQQVGMLPYLIDSTAVGIARDASDASIRP
ncbi:hypothetical protein K458DRAFT_393346 [Lentithecium fluviatile CBS 122367]|uniref:Uncharacterized protein n=1 Tax=Lentithecium fluviatile CBS 122367 TaxID=1168545 RepID=A0A6G1IQ17_9PLEO|nr:hypothetical protein K458DRAFT_393346 [Lentithecium fluviatile CBS 122367]